MPISDDECCYCAGEVFARISIGIEIVEGKTRPTWLPSDTQRAEAVCIDCLKKSIDMGDDVTKAVEDLADRLTPKAAPGLRLITELPEGTD